MNPLQAVLGLLLLFLLPGYFLLLALFPRRRWFGPFHVIALPAFSVLVSTGILVLVGSILGFLPGGLGGKGWFQGSQTGAPVLETVLGGLTLIFFVAAWARGAFPLLARRRSLAEARARKGAPGDWTERGEPSEMTILRDMRLEEERLRKEAKRVRERARESRDMGVQTALHEAAEELLRQRRAVGAKARELERRAGEQRYG